MDKGEDVCGVAELKPGDMKCVFLGATRVLLSNVDGKVYATSDVCSHALAYLSDGWLEGPVVECPLHGAQFDVTTGKALSALANGDIETYEVTVADGRIFVASAQLASAKS
ncbi:non-heme iron oxygenase ferredoxin subunit [Paraburkholderia panacisoli]|jgi:naphthalene 1,2-dioxygenase system ferredoxin subunit|uniref:Non-heme iron oxygenase ferredoxin subunit n=1 Tax=Paraburkholderia panacisoli TaxID=2603818 RepID=A0A5B0G2W3_9BURK|nr:non-heme iron oxygenase ferredoxin subunit [Paraburkholderia panacisoli]KAA0997764.1 non-heme iron oxygenase ferredoxin subunit [Paraburkholderia panacisoli]KAA0997779.1 non-heme iron oxygenase ferredoxin subunit [Paraburkholderia panacisoli]